MTMNIPPLTHIEKNPDDEGKQIRDFMYTKNEFIELLKAKQRVFGEPGASLTWGIDGSVSSQSTAGSQGEKQVGKLLDAYAEKNRKVFIFHSSQWPGSKGDTDHILVCGNLMLIIDAKRWKSKRKYSVTANGTVLRGTVAFPEGKVKMMPAMASWRKELGKGIKVMGVVCIAQEEVFVPYDKNWHSAPYRLVTAERLEEYLDKFLANSKPAQEKPNLQMLVTIGEKIIKARNRRREIINLDLL